MNKKVISAIILISTIIVVFLFTIQLGGRWIYVHELEFEPDFSSDKFYNLTVEDMKRFPFLLESIQIDDDVYISEEEYDFLVDFLNSSRHIEGENRYYEVQLRMS